MPRVVYRISAGFVDIVSRFISPNGVWQSSVRDIIVTITSKYERNSDVNMLPLHVYFEWHFFNGWSSCEFEMLEKMQGKESSQNESD